MSSAWEQIAFHFRVTVGSSIRFAQSPGLQEATRTKTGGRRKETGEMTSAVRRTVTAKKRRRKGAEDTVGAVWMAAGQRPAGRTAGTSPVRQEATVGQEAIRPNSGHVLGRAWPQQVQLRGIAGCGRETLSIDSKYRTRMRRGQDMESASILQNAEGGEPAAATPYLMEEVKEEIAMEEKELEPRKQLKESGCVSILFKFTR
ncbi:hypothetical protein NDU88_005415 [Pleurodeles waltl]|uniref:Uncharacterized protein n=1 Tax=Pleurodeles waltl TaxID=8319 RepID=A0AAV7RKZ9_PLEWA|nr:hypothetical protein NDU88_005415 [Pleurodeles waltl]